MEGDGSSKPIFGSSNIWVSLFVSGMDVSVRFRSRLIDWVSFFNPSLHMFCLCSFGCQFHHFTDGLWLASDGLARNGCSCLLSFVQWVVGSMNNYVLAGDSIHHSRIMVMMFQNLDSSQDWRIWWVLLVVLPGVDDISDAYEYPRHLLDLTWDCLARKTWMLVVIYQKGLWVLDLVHVLMVISFTIFQTWVDACRLW
jgi:hypothetical protein